MSDTDRPTRNRSLPAGSLESRLQKFVDELRLLVKAAEPGPKRDALIEKLKKAEMSAAAARRLGE